MTMKKNLRITALLCFAALAVALVSQYLFDMPPCAWCVLQRLVYLVIGVVCLIASLPRSSFCARLGEAAAFLLAVAGVLIAHYQVTVANHLVTCNLTFADRVISQSHLDSAVPWLFGIYASCADAVVEILGLQYAAWSLILFVLLALWTLWGLVRGKKAR